MLRCSASFAESSAINSDNSCLTICALLYNSVSLESNLKLQYLSHSPCLCALPMVSSRPGRYEVGPTESLAALSQHFPCFKLLPYVYSTEIRTQPAGESTTEKREGERDDALRDGRWLCWGRERERSHERRWERRRERGRSDRKEYISVTLANTCCTRLKRGQTGGHSKNIYLIMYSDQNYARCQGFIPLEMIIMQD